MISRQDCCEATQPGNAFTRLFLVAFLVYSSQLSPAINARADATANETRTMTATKFTAVPGAPFLHLGNYDIGSLNYVAEEFFFSGDAVSYAPVAPFKADGKWQVESSDKAQYTTRLVVMRPQDNSKFNGTVLVEWLNVSGGLDAPAEWLMAHREIVRSGYAYVGVSAQKVGVEGGKSLGRDMSLKTVNPKRYGSLKHPGDAFSYDIFSQAGKLVHTGILGPLKPLRVLAAGESQSAIFMVTYINAIDPLTKVYDGFLVHSRYGGAAPLDSSTILGQTSSAVPEVAHYRSDLRAPVMTVITETDLFSSHRRGYLDARQADNMHLRVWEIPGTAHADNYTVQVAPIDTGLLPVAKIAQAFAPTRNLMGAELDKPINFAPQHHYVLQAALSALNDWVSSGEPAPAASPIDVTTEEKAAKLALDDNGLATGGVRTPWVQVPVARTSGDGNGGSPMAFLFGSGELFDAATLAKLYPKGKTQYLQRFTLALDDAIASGFILAADRAEILELADLLYPMAQ